jgi:hypothetical protein
MSLPDAHVVELIPIERITVINPRVRNKKIFKEIVTAVRLKAEQIQLAADLVVVEYGGGF